MPPMKLTGDPQDQEILIEPNWKDRELRVTVEGLSWKAVLVSDPDIVGYGQTPTDALDVLQEQILNHYTYWRKVHKSSLDQLIKPPGER